MSRKPEKATEQEKKKRKRKKQTKQTITRAVTHIRLIEANPGKLAALDALMAVYLPLCQQYTTLFCASETGPGTYSDPVFETALSDRLHRVAMQQAAGIAKSFRTNRANAYQRYLGDAADYVQARAKAEAEGRMSTFKRTEPVWQEWKLPQLRVPVIQANANVVVVEKSKDTLFDYWLGVSTLNRGHPLRVPVKLASYHKQALAGKTLNTSTTLHKRDREKRRRKAKLRACLAKKGVPKDKLPSTSSETSQRLSRQVKQEINRAVNDLIKDHPDARLIYEDLKVASMRFHARSMNAYLYASQLGHIPEQLAWAAAKGGMAAHTVRAAYSSQECPRCHFVDRANRPTQKTFQCVVCGYEDHADLPETFLDLSQA